MPLPAPSGFFIVRHGWSRCATLSKQFDSSDISRLTGAGWTAHTSPAYPLSWPLLTAAAMASLSQMAPRAVLTSQAPFLKLLSRSSLIRPRVPSCSGQLTVITSHWIGKNNYDKGIRIYPGDEAQKRRPKVSRRLRRCLLISWLSCQPLLRLQKKIEKTSPVRRNPSNQQHGAH